MKTVKRFAYLPLLFLAALAITSAISRSRDDHSSFNVVVFVAAAVLTALATAWIDWYRHRTP